MGGSYNPELAVVPTSRERGAEVVGHGQLLRGIVGRDARGAAGLYRSVARDESLMFSLPPELAHLPHDWDEDHGRSVFGAMQFANHWDGRGRQLPTETSGH